MVEGLGFRVDALGLRALGLRIETLGFGDWGNIGIMEKKMETTI